MDELTTLYQQQVQAATDKMLELKQVDIPTDHIFAPGIACRTIRIPPDTLIAGKIHKHKLLNILLSGTIVVTKDGVATELTGPMIYVGNVGEAKVAYTKTEVLWSNIMATDITDVEELEQEFVCKNLIEYKNFLQLSNK